MQSFRKPISFATGTILSLYFVGLARAATLERSLMPLISSHRGDVAVAIKHLKTGDQFLYQANNPMPTASLIKLPVMIEAYRQVHEGKIQLDQKCLVTKDSKVPGSGVLTYHFSDNTEIKLRDALRLMIVFSDNTATNLVVDAIGLKSTAKTMEDLGFPNTKLHAKVYRRDTSIFPDRSQQFGLGSTTAAEMIRLLEMLHSGSIVSPSSCQAMITHLQACDDDSKICRLLPKQIKVAHKTGAVAKSRTDAGLIETPSGTIAICILTNDNHDHSWDDTNEAHVLCGKIAKATLDFFHPNPQSAGPQQLAIGATGELVESLQRTINQRLQPSPNLAIDGDFGPATQAAVESFQQQENLKANGVVDQATWKALGNLITQGPPVPAPEIINSQTISKSAADSTEGPPFVTCKGWIAVNADTGVEIGGAHQTKKMHPASTTKIMTALVVLRLAEQDPAIFKEPITFSERADQTTGSTAAVEAGEIVAAEELLYGLMLPSGNDASVALGQHFGDRFRTESDSSEQTAYELFVREMNRTAKEIGMDDTTYDNTHGLTAETHLTTPADLAILGRKAMEIPLFRKIVATPQYGCLLRSESGYTRNTVWKNTNRLLKIEGYNGIKTGTTRAAGACLVAHGSRAGKNLIVVVLGASSSDARYVDMRNLFRWAWLN